MTPEEFNKYCQFIRVITQRLNEHFENQKEYLFCKKGCSFCCENGEYPCSKLESEFLNAGIALLDKDSQNAIFSNIEKIKNKQKNFNEKKFYYVCPFLIQHKCSIYNFRPLICRVFGLSYYSEKMGKREVKIPFCVEKGLNYSKVYDNENNYLSMEMFKSAEFKHEPLATNLSPEFLKIRVGKDLMNLEFGEEKPLIDWF